MLRYHFDDMDPYSARLNRLRLQVKLYRASAAVIGSTDHMRYLLGWTELTGERLMCLWVPVAGDPALIVPALSYDDARRSVEIVSVVPWHDSDGWHDTLKPFLGAVPEGGTVLVDDELAAGHVILMQSMVGALNWGSVTPAMTALRGVKDSSEIAAMERSAALADQVYDDVLTIIRPGVSELDLQREILGRFSECGASSAWAIVCFGANTASPHHRTGDARLEVGDMVILDLGGCLDGYQSDITRTFACGVDTDEARRIYAVVHQAHMAVMETARPGVACEAVDAAARRVIADAGYGERFIHRTGHGIGLSTHEPPNLVAGESTTLQAGMCFSNEPGIYLTGRFGVRIENIITITETGCRSLNRAAPETLPVR